MVHELRNPKSLDAAHVSRQRDTHSKGGAAKAWRKVPRQQLIQWYEGYVGGGAFGSRKGESTGMAAQTVRQKAAIRRMCGWSTAAIFSNIESAKPLLVDLLTSNNALSHATSTWRPFFGMRLTALGHLCTASLKS